ESYLLAHPSYQERFGVAVVEALACGCPVIVSDQVYLHPRISAAGVGGVVGLTVEAVAQELEAWLEQRGTRDEAARRARAYALQTFGWDRIGEAWVGHYGRILAAR